MEYVRAHVFIKGRVQGVFFRARTSEEACKFDLTGWVRNCNDGRVEAIFEGGKENVEKVVDWCKRGPLDAKVTDVEVKAEQATG
jgi:Acylphosphatases